MLGRQEFIKDASSAQAGIAFVACSLATAAHGQPRQLAQGQSATASRPSSAARRREVVINGHRVKTVDVHAHCSIPEAMAIMGLKVSQSLIMADERIQVMDEQGIDVEALSINPYWYEAERDVVREVIRIQNEKLAELCAANPDRFVAFATAALQYPELAVEQLVHGVKKLGLRGLSVGGSVNGEELANPKFHPVWAKAEELGVLVFIHPQGTAELNAAGRLTGSGGLENTIGNPLETTIALSHLIFEGTLDRYPGLKICAVHGGGYLPSYANRSDAVCTTFPNRITVKLKKKPTEYMRQMYYDSLVFTPEALRHLAAEMGSSQIVMGTDYPFPWTSTSVDHILNTPGLSDAERVAMLGGTATKLLGIG